MRIYFLYRPISLLFIQKPLKNKIQQSLPVQLYKEYNPNNILIIVILSRNQNSNCFVIFIIEKYLVKRQNKIGQAYRKLVSVMDIKHNISKQISYRIYSKRLIINTQKIPKKEVSVFQGNLLKISRVELIYLVQLSHIKMYKSHMRNIVQDSSIHNLNTMKHFNK